MDKVKKWKLECDAKKLVEILNERKYNAVYVDNINEAKEKVLELVEEGSSIALGGSVTLNEMDLVNTIRNGNYNFYDRYQDLPFSEIVEIMRQSMVADYLITSTNAVTEAGELVNMDCSGNRAAGMIFGPKKVIVVIGANKMVKDMDEALDRIKRVAIMNAKRINHKTPCAESGNCEDCFVKGRVCNYLSVVNNGAKFPGRFTVIVIADEVGY
ncbi:lactate utilization protein [Clostridium chauvoei]|uniref:LUD domain-containing protein n=2 Tax=Clostridium chauvoei TaxID=46867 RepID=S6F6T6_9CLOT|nr:lactate utilization protein [Clostridium chauvoei]ATD56039.1 lactate utilization protein [Clostridium chauvoei]ATD58186.1 lactate utilization protein [Clostridium chauvoei]MBX7281633.1 lactate utilization protein [Clostridium chauvoei]MBX7284146.1 lactate utilization protein [Clostridium chauvoei]MBX7286674.1 lactate utilization protein [Clostridium chauvoei]